MSEKDGKEVLEIDALIYVAYKGIESAMKALKEYKENHGKISPTEGNFNSLLKNLSRGYIEKLPVGEKLLLKYFFQLPWPDAVKLISDFALSLGKKKDGTYKTIGDVISDILGNYIGA